VAEVAQVAWVVRSPVVGIVGLAKPPVLQAAAVAADVAQAVRRSGAAAGIADLAKPVVLRAGAVAAHAHFYSSE
jgi:hypothetical protein